MTTATEREDGILSMAIPKAWYDASLGGFCQHCDKYPSKRAYGENEDGMFTGWRYPFCSAECYKDWKIAAGS